MATKNYSEADTRIRDVIAILASRPGQSFETVAIRLGLSDRTLRRKRARPDTFTLLEIRRLKELAYRHGLIIDIS
jgi:predicted transcriptional regulator